MPASFEGFSLPEQQKMAIAFMEMKKASAKAKTDLLNKKMAAFNTWFDATGRYAHLMKVATIVKEIDLAINTRPITFANASGNKVDASSKGLCGYVWLVQRGQFVAHVGSGMRVLVVPRTHRGNVGDLAQTMYHELSHKVGSTRDITYDRTQCQQNARINPHLAAQNAENFNLFLGEYL